MERIRCSMGIMAHNEEANVGRLLARVGESRLARVDVTEIIVVASGCTDRTEEVVCRAADRDGRIRLISQPTREGKASAMNLFLAQATSDVLVLSSADLLPGEDSLEQLVAPFADPEIGMTACRPMPVNDPATFMGFAAHLLWELHHQMNVSGGFKAGEMIAFRKVFARIPPHTAVDEASVEPLIRGQGYAVSYTHLDVYKRQVSLRLTNTYGPRMRIRDARQTFIGWWFRQLLEGRELQIFGDGLQVRDFNYIDDVVEALLMVAAHDVADGQIYNLGGDEPINLINLARLMIEVNGGGSFALTPFPADRKRIDIGDFYGDYRKIRSKLGWRPLVGLRDGLTRTMDYFRDHLEHYV